MIIANIILLDMDPMALLDHLLGEDKTDPNASANKELGDFLPPIVAQPQPLSDDDEYNPDDDDSNNGSKSSDTGISLDYYND